jgi:hypothetical protein
MTIGDTIEKTIFERYSEPHIGTNQLELIFKDKRGCRTLHMIVSNLGPQLTSEYDTGHKLVANIGRAGKHINYKYVPDMGRDRIYSEGVLTIVRHDSDRKLKPMEYSYSIHTTTSTSLSPYEKSPEVITILGDDGSNIKLYTRHVAVGIAEVGMIVMPF